VKGLLELNWRQTLLFFEPVWSLGAVAGHDFLSSAETPGKCENVRTILLAAAIGYRRDECSRGRPAIDDSFSGLVGCLIQHGYFRVRLTMLLLMKVPGSAGKYSGRIKCGPRKVSLVAGSSPLK
jgi:hypothetical protein